MVKGGHRIADATDVLFDGKDFHYYKGKRIESTSTHGTGCSLSSAIASNLANGMNLSDAVQAAKTYVFEGIAHAEPIGKGHGPIHHSMNYTRKQGCSNMKTHLFFEKDVLPGHGSSFYWRGSLAATPQDTYEEAARNMAAHPQGAYTLTLGINMLRR